MQHPWAQRREGMDVPRFQPDGNDDRFPQVAQRLFELRENLSTEAMKAYHALQLSLARHSTPHGSRPNFDKDFHDSLRALFPDAWEVHARQIGSGNQWEVIIDGGRPIYCSVRLEILGDNGQFMKDIKTKSRAVKDTLLKDNGKWKQTLQAEYGGFNYEKLLQFEKECERSDWDKPETVRGYTCNNSVWIESRNECKICKRPKEEDQLNGCHMCVVFATFNCPDCRFSWSSYHGRLRPDEKTLMGQQCSRCGGSGQAKDWRVMANQPMDTGGSVASSSKAQYRMHQRELCDACREFGNCMGVFHDPFILTTALSIVSGQFVQWKSFSEDIPELLIADLGPQFSELQICLQPHVYVPQGEEQEPPMHRPGAGASGRWQPKADSSRDRTERIMRSQRAGQPSNSGVFSNGQVAEDGAAGRSSSAKDRQDRRPVERLFGKDDPPMEAKKQAGGVKDQRLLQKFISKAEDLNPPGGGSTAQLLAEQEHAASMAEMPGTNVMRSCAKDRGWEWQLAAASSGKGDTAVVETKEVAQEADTGELKQAPDKASEKNKMKKFNKITVLDPEMTTQSRAPKETPLLNSVPPLRRVQFLQIVLRQVLASGGTEADKFSSAEDILLMCNGDLDKAYQYVKSMNSGGAPT